MKVTQEKLPASQIGLEIEVPSDVSKKVYERVVQEFTRSVNIPGFRKGKVPRSILIQRLGATRIKAAAVEELVEDSLKEAVKQEKIDALGNFQLRTSFDDLVAQFQPGEPLTFSASVDVAPEVNLTQSKGFTVQAEEIKPNADRVDEVLADYQERLATLIPVEGRAAQMKDVAVVDFTGVLPAEDGEGEAEPIPGGEAQDFQLELLEGRFIAGFIDGIVGMNPGETKEISAQFPEDYPQETVAGRAALFTVTLKELKEKELPELDDDFAQEISEFETLAELQESLTERYAKEADEKTQDNKEEAILEELLKHVEAEIPETLIDREVSFMLNQTAMQLQNQGLDVKRLFTQETVGRLREQSRPDAINRIKRTLALGEIAKQESIAVQPDELSTRVTEVLEGLGDQAQSVDRDRLESVVSEDLLKEKILAWVIENSNVELVPEGTLTAKEDAPADTEAEVAASDAIVEADVVSAAPEDEPEPEAPTETASKKKAKSAKAEAPEASESAEGDGSPKRKGAAKKKKSEPNT